MEEEKDSAVEYWLGKIKKEEKAHEEWRKRAETAEKAYYDEGSHKQLFNLFYSTVNTLHARLFSKDPVPDVRRRYNLQGQEGMAAKQAALLIERGLSYTLDTTPFFTNADHAVKDFLIAGAGVPRIKYKADVSTDDKGDPAQIRLQQVELSHTPWRRFHWEPGKCWEDCDWVAFDDYLTAREIKEQWGKSPSEGGKTSSDEKTGANKFHQLYRVTELWYRPKRTIYVLGWDFDEILETRKDALNLQGFYPCPRPMFANVKSAELVPTPDHHFQAESYNYVNRLTGRIHNITKQIKAAGFYDAQLTELGDLAGASDGEYKPIKNLAERLASTGVSDFNKVMATLPLKEKVEVVRELQNLLLMEKQRLDEANGISDIVRGNTDPNETATAQQIKGNWASLRLSRKTGEVSRCLRDCFRIMSEIMAEHFTPESLYLMSGIRPESAVLQVIKSDLGRSLAIDVETDSTIAMEDEAEKTQKLEFLNYVSPFIQQVVPAMTQGMLPADLGKEMLRLAAGAFKHGRALEDAIEAAPGSVQQMQQMQQGAQQAQMQAQQAGQALQQCQQELAKCQQALQQAQQNGEMAKAEVEKQKLDFETRKLDLEERRVNQELRFGQEKHGVETETMGADRDSAVLVAETLATVQEATVAQAEAAIQTFAQLNETLQTGLAAIAQTVQTEPKTKTIEMVSDGGKRWSAVVTE